MSLPPHLVPFWSDYAKTTSAAIEERFYEAFSFGDSEELANDLAALVLRGTKRATAGALWSYEAEGKRLPRQPLCVIETLSVEVVPFNEVTADFAATEGEGDGSLSFWRGAHRAYFTRECVSVGREFLENMLISCERFAVVYRPSTSAAQAPSHRGPFR